ncbi:HK97 gp10 family phage protein [Orenia marismortui]|uniref:Bacteriophage HK97-gp10 putative tail-component n=1 Tax=Orenia marismortui TaxID=46469 RepID=A0A4R8GFQ8_9FIRM|nr:HK97 gp10 family phage protein [Orenia marismortui]TDX44322.1 bacteriophage HK97-gp10 putative tail-component [Orenia marismortui]
MDSFVQIEWTDLKNEARKLDRYTNKINNELEAIMLRAALIVEAEIKVIITELGLVDTGFLRMNWSSTAETILNDIIGKVGTTTEYAKWLNDGTENKDGSTRIKAYRFIQKAKFRCKDKVLRYIKNELKKVDM